MVRFSPRARELTGRGVHPDLRLTINQGVCGRAYRDGKETSKKHIKGVVLLPEILTAEAEADNNFTAEQKKITKEVKFVVSCPLIIRQKEGMDKR